MNLEVFVKLWKVHKKWQITSMRSAAESMKWNKYLNIWIHGLNRSHCCKQRILWQTESLKNTAFIQNRNIISTQIHSLVDSALFDCFRKERKKKKNVKYEFITFNSMHPWWISASISKFRMCINVYQVSILPIFNKLLWFKSLWEQC